MNVRNEIKAQIIRAGMTMQEVVDLLSDEYGWSDSISNLSAKLQRESIRYKEVLELADVLGYDIVWQQRQCCLWMAVKDAANVCKKRSAEQLHADGLTMGKGADIFAVVSRGHRSDRIPPRESPRRAHGTLQPVWMKVS